MAKKKNWIKSAIRHPGAEKRAAKKAGMSTHAYMEEHKNSPGKAGSRARLGLRLSAMSNRKDGGTARGSKTHARLDRKNRGGLCAGNNPVDMKRGGKDR